MCVALPGQVIEVGDGIATIERSGRRMRASTVLYPAARPGQWVLVATGLITRRASAREAHRIDALLSQATVTATEGREAP